MAKKVLKEKLEIWKNISRYKKYFSHYFQCEKKNLKIKIMTEKCKKMAKIAAYKKTGSKFIEFFHV